MLNQDTTLLKYISYLLYKIITPKVREMPETGSCDYWCRLSWQQAGFIKLCGKSHNLCQWLPNSKWNLLHCWGKSSLETIVGTSMFGGKRSHISSRSIIMDLSTHHQAVFAWVLVWQFLWFSLALSSLKLQSNPNTTMMKAFIIHLAKAPSYLSVG